jgi:hypothetical protein
MTIQFETTAGTRKVISFANDRNSIWHSRLYVNNGETATLTSAKHKSEAGARKWAAKALAA